MGNIESTVRCTCKMSGEEGRIHPGMLVDVLVGIIYVDAAPAGLRIDKGIVLVDASVPSGMSDYVCAPSPGIRGHGELEEHPNVTSLCTCEESLDLREAVGLPTR